MTSIDKSTCDLLSLLAEWDPGRTVIDLAVRFRALSARREAAFARYGIAEKQARIVLENAEKLRINDAREQS